jgi:predicted methyltransferase
MIPAPLDREDVLMLYLHKRGAYPLLGSAAVARQERLRQMGYLTLGDDGVRLTDEGREVVELALAEEMP